jgi:hypothetical protein
VDDTPPGRRSARLRRLPGVAEGPRFGPPSTEQRASLRHAEGVLLVSSMLRWNSLSGALEAHAAVRLK